MTVIWFFIMTVFLYCAALGISGSAINDKDDDASLYASLTCCINRVNLYNPFLICL